MCIRDRPYGTLIATYQYDPWGNPRGIKDASGKAIAQTGNHIATYNPFRYRGYRYDVDTGLYYLQSRYYDPMTCRFVNADRYASTGQGPIGNNMFSYCNNSPVRYDDQTGAMISGPGYMCVNDGGHAGPSEIGEDDDTSVIAGRQKKVKRKDDRHGNDQRSQTGARERNVGHPNGEEYSRRAKGNRGVRRSMGHPDIPEPIFSIPKMNLEGNWCNVIEGGALAIGGVIVLAIVVLDDATVVGCADDAAIPILGELIRKGVGMVFG